MKTVTFTVYGKSQPKGSARAFIPKGWKRPIITSTNRNLKQWEQLVAGAAQQAAKGLFFTGPVILDVIFYLPRPKSIGDKMMRHIKKPDTSKLVRSAEDALTSVLWNDDAQVVEIRARKQYAPFGATPCVQIAVMEAEPAAEIQPMPRPLFQEACP